MKRFTVVKNFEWTEVSKCWEVDLETNRKRYYWKVYQCNSQRTNSYYLGITQGRAKRLARGHRLPFRPSNCGEGLVKLKDKLYIPSATFKYNRLDKKLVISQNTYFKRKLISKKLIEE